MDNEGHRLGRERLVVRKKLSGPAALLTAALAGVTGVTLAGTAIAHRLRASAPAQSIEVTHLPPLLTLPGEPIELRYDAYCVPAESESHPPCNADGSVFVRAGDRGPFREIPLRIDPDADEGRYVAVVPEEVAESRTGFFYYAVVRSGDDGATSTLPAAGPTAPQRSVPLGPAAYVELGRHAFGAVRRADARLIEAAWGDGTNEIGLEQGRSLPPIGASAFDVDPDGTVHVLDEAHRRLLRWRPGTRSPEQVPLAIHGTLADMSVADSGTIYVLETARGMGRSPVLRIFGANGEGRGEAETAEGGAHVRIGPAGPVVLQYPSGQWMPAATDSRPLTPSAQRAGGRAGRPLPGGGEVVVLRRENEIRTALVAANGARRAWRIRSETPLAEVQLAEPVGGGLLLVVRVYTDNRDEFLVLELGAKGLLHSFSLDSADWAEAAPLSRFRVVGSALYQLGSTPGGVFVDRFGLEVK